MPLEGVLAFSHAWTHGCFLALGYCYRGLGFHHSFIRGNLPFLSAQKDSHRLGGVSPPVLALKCKAATFSSPRPSPHSCFSLWQLGLAQGPTHHSVLFSRGHLQQYNSPVVLARKLCISNLLMVPFTLGKGFLVLLPKSLSNLATDVGLTDSTYIFTCSIGGRSKNHSPLAYHSFVFLQCFQKS